jgi:hypothetical protein
VKLLRSDKRGFVFHLGEREKHLLLETLQLYPLIPASHHRIARNRDTPADDERQRLLEEALAEHRRENRRQLQAMLNETHRFRETEAGFQLNLSAPQIEWLLQVLNDIRVGSWLALGEPEQGEEPVPDKNNAHCLLALEVCGLFESGLLAALGVHQSPRWH